jgi:hypothetical protein
MDEVKVYTGYVECFCWKMHKAATLLTVINWSKLLDNKDKSFWCLIVAM